MRIDDHSSVGKWGKHFIIGVLSMTAASGLGCVKQPVAITYRICLLIRYGDSFPVISLIPPIIGNTTPSSDMKLVLESREELHSCVGQIDC